MTVIETEQTVVDGYYKSLIRSLDLVNEFEAVTGKTLEDHELEVSEGILIEDVLEEAEDDYLFLTTRNHPREYRVEQLPQ